MEYVCGICQTIISDMVSMSHCHGTCGEYFHVSCAGISQNAINAMRESEGVKWFCEICRKIGITEVLEGISRLEAKTGIDLVKITKKISDLSRKLATASGIPQRVFDFETPRSSKRARISPLQEVGARKVWDSEVATTCEGERSALFAIAPSPPPRVQFSFLHVSNIHCDSKVDDLVSFVTEHTGLETKDILCYKLVKLGANISTYNFVSYKVGVPEDKFGVISDPLFWPKGTRIKDFVDRRSGRRPIPRAHIPRADISTIGVSGVEKSPI